MTEVARMAPEAAAEQSGPAVAMADATVEDAVAASEDEELSDEELENLLLLEITIDGMCGVY